MPLHKIIRRLFFPVVILISFLLSASSWLPGKQETITSEPILQDDITDINPTYEWGAFLSEESRFTYDIPGELAVDEFGDLIVLSSSVNSSIESGYRFDDPSQVRITKITKSGSVKWRTALDTAENTASYSGSLALDRNGNIFITGISYDRSSPFYTQKRDEIFVAKFDPNGSLIWNTFIKIDSPFLSDMTVDGEGNVYAIGEAGETGVYTVVKLNTNGTLEWTTTLGEFQDFDVFDPDYQANFYKIRTDSSGFVYAVGDVGSSWGNPIQRFVGIRDIFVAKLDNAGQLLWNTFLGSNGTNNDLDSGLVQARVDNLGNIYVVGESENNWGNPIVALSGNTDSYLAKLDPNGNLLWSTFIPGEGSGDIIWDIAINKNNNPILFGNSETSWGNSNRAFEKAKYDDFISEFDPNGSVMWNIFIQAPGRQYTLADETNFYFLSDGGYFLREPEKIAYLGIDYDDDDNDLFIAKLNLYSPSITTYRPPSVYVPDLTLHIPTPLDISTDPGVIGTNVLLAVFLMLPFAIAVDVFSRIFSENEAMLNGFAPIAWIGKLQKRLQNIASSNISKEGFRDILGLLGVVAFYGFVFSLLDKTWNPLTIKGVFLFISMAFAFGLVGLLDDIVQWRTIRRWGHQGEFTVRPTNIFLAAVSTTVSRLLALVPGLMFGSPEALRINEEELSTSQNKTLTRISMLTYVVIGLTAWLPTIATTLLQRQAISENQKNLVAGLEALLLVIFAVALENVFVQLVGVSDGLGKKMKAWNKWSWGGALALSAFAFLHTLLNPHYDFVSALQQGNIVVFISVSAAFILITFALSFFIRYRNRQKEKR